MAKKTAVNLDFMTEEKRGPDMGATFQAGASTEASAAKEHEAILVGIEQLLDNPYQPRTTMDETGIAELAQVIRSQGFQGVLVARPAPGYKDYYQLTAGHRRRNAAQLAGLTALPILVRELTNEEMVMLAITENIQREDLTAIEEGRIFALMNEELGYTHEQVAMELGKSRGYIENRLRIVRAPRDVQRMVERRPDTIRAVSELIKVEDEQLRQAAIDELLSGNLTADDLPGFLASLDPTNNPGGEVETEQVAQEKKRRQGRRRTSDTSTDERTLSRIGNAKLDVAIRALLAYKETLPKRGAITIGEAGSLAQIASLVDELLTSRQAQG